MFTNKKIFGAAIAIVLASILATIALYVWQFGTHLSTKQDEWAGFGDYFGGVLNPVFALLAFFGLLWSIQKQGAEFRDSLQLLQRQTTSAEDQVKALREERTLDDLLHVVKELDSRIERVLDIVITTQGPIVLTVREMKSEAQRLKRTPSGPPSPAYRNFVDIAKRPGSVVEAHVRELTYLVQKTCEFLEAYAALQPWLISPTLRYYAEKCSDLMDMVEDVGNPPIGTRGFFASIAGN
ncbi:hypothetical protein [Paraburkholderia sp. BR13444]|uniref:hypothetical protein n=1 Tax=Paraburkholderia sp. BR13444 TaxID=3236997 RepID=UPI0034D01C18